MPEPTSDQPVPDNTELLEAAKQQVLQEVFGGKYNDINAAKQGVYNLQNSAAELFQTQQMLENQLRSNPGQAAASRAAAPSPFATLESDHLLPQDLMRAAMREEASRIYEEQFGPIQRTAVARQQIASTFENYGTEEKAMLQYVQGQPELYQRLVHLQDTDPLAAMELGYLHYQRSKPPAGSPSPAERAAGALPNSGGSVSRQEPAGLTEEQQMAIIQRAMQTGDLRELAHHSIQSEPVIPDWMKGN